MILRNIILLVTIIVAHVPALYASDDKWPWDAVLIDVSGDVVCHDKTGRSEMQLITAIIDELRRHSDVGDSVTVFARGCAVVPFKALLDDRRHKFENLRSSIGDGTHIYDAMLSVHNTAEVARRLLVITNGLDNGSSFHPKTTAKILKSKRIVVDAVSVYLPADSITMDSIYSPKPAMDNNFADFIKSTGGNFATIKDKREARPTLRLLHDQAVGSDDRPSTEYRHGYDEAILHETLRRILPRQSEP